jgi:Ca2+-binding RTX toxin-like protein
MSRSLLSHPPSPPMIASLKRQGVALLTAFFLSIVGLAMLPSAAVAAVSCTFDTTTGTLAVNVTSGSEDVSLHEKADSTEIEVGDGYFPGNVSCAGGTPTVDNTSSITLEDAAGNTARLVLHLRGGVLGPGTGGASEAGGDPEIEISFDGNDSTEEWGDQILVHGGSGGERWRMGTLAGDGAVDLNDDGDLDDLVATDVEGYDFWSNEGDDVVRADGGGGFDGPLRPAVSGRFVGGEGDDVLRAGDGSWFLTGDAPTGPDGNDRLIGADGPTEFRPEGGNDVALGKAGKDTCDYTNMPDALEIDLRIDEAQQTRGAGRDRLECENVMGGDGDDRLIGTAGANAINGGITESGDDRLVGKGGRDYLFGEAGIDTLLAKDGVNDHEIDCGAPDTPEIARVDGLDPPPIGC